MLELNEKECEALYELISRLEQRWDLVPIPENNIWHAYDPLPFDHFMRGIKEAEVLTKGRRFLDLGCGIGTKLALMYCMNWEVKGVERYKHYFNSAKELVPEAELIYENIMNVTDFDADLVYMYRPARSDDLEDQLEKHVMKNIKKGTVCFFPLRHAPEVWVV